MDGQTAEIHLVNPLWDAAGGSEWRTIELYRQLREQCSAFLWTEHKPDPVFAKEYPIRRISYVRRRFPKTGVLVVVGVYSPLGWWEDLDCFFYRTSEKCMEASGRVISEAMACGVPIVCHKRGGYRELIQDGKNGFLFESNEQAYQIILRLKENPDLRRGIGRAARLTMESLHCSEVRKGVLDYYIEPTPPIKA